MFVTKVKEVKASKTQENGLVKENCLPGMVSISTEQINYIHFRQFHNLYSDKNTVSGCPLTGQEFTLL